MHAQWSFIILIVQLLDKGNRTVGDYITVVTIFKGFKI